MTALWAWLSDDLTAGATVAAAMGRALRVDAGQVEAHWSVGPLHVGLLEIPGDTADYAPVTSEGDRYYLWLAGEAFEGGGLVRVTDAAATRTPAFRRALLNALLARGADALAELDGEYHVVLWDARDRELTIANDRFGGMPFYWTQAPGGFACAAGVRGVLAAPSVSRDPDVEAIREAVTFGGYRLGDRTQVSSVKMLPGASVLTVQGGAPRLRRYWTWGAIPPERERPLAALVDELDARWRQSIRRRLDGAQRPGQTLSGGLDSRAILAEARPRVPSWVGITYGLPGCDDARYAEQAARACGATWIFQPLYRDGWLDERDAFIQPTDGLIDLIDLCHLETLGLQRRMIDVHLSGYVGDAVAGGTFNFDEPERVLDSMPFYETPLGLDRAEAQRRIDACVAALDGAPARFALFEHKLPQAVNRWSAAWRPWLRVRKPFVDYAVFDFCQGLPVSARAGDRLRQGWLRARYPSLFATIPQEKTGMPVGTPPWRVTVERARRFAWRKVQPRLLRLGFDARPRVRSYRDDDGALASVRGRIEAVLDDDSLCASIFGREPLRATLSQFFRGEAPVQVIGALYSFERYHRGLGAWLAARA